MLHCKISVPSLVELEEFINDVSSYATTVFISYYQKYLLLLILNISSQKINLFLFINYKTPYNKNKIIYYVLKYIIFEKGALH